MPLEEKISSVRYIARPNALGIESFCLKFSGEEGTLEMEKDSKRFSLEFGLCENKQTCFSFGDRPAADWMGKNVPGEYGCAVSAAWADGRTFSIMAQVIDTYFGCLNIHIGFKDDRATLLLKKSGQYVFDGIEGSLIASAEKE